MSDHPGFTAIQRRIAGKRNPRTGKPYGMKRAGAILGHAKREQLARERREGSDG